MAWTSNYQHPEGMTFKIELDEAVGYYLYVYNNEGRNTHDYLQDTLDFAKDDALEYFGVPVDSWTEIEDKP